MLVRGFTVMEVRFYLYKCGCAQPFVNVSCINDLPRDIYASRCWYACMDKQLKRTLPVASKLYNLMAIFIMSSLIQEAPVECVHVDGTGTS